MTEYVFGFHAVEAVLKHDPKRIQQLWLQQGRRDKRAQALAALAQNQGVAINDASKDALNKKVEGRHQGVVAQVAPRAKDATINERDLIGMLESWPNPLLLVLDGVTDPHNLGACLRSADAAGVNAVIVPKNNSADITPVVQKVACGAAESMPLVRVTNLARTLNALQDAGVWVVGTSGDAEEMLYDRDLSGAVALVMGAEGDGMRRLTQEQCDYLVKLPMAGVVSSLNVSVATGICLFEAVRQRAAS